MADEDTYRSLATSSEGFYREKGSKFNAFAYPVADEEAVRERLDELRKQYYDARHHCYAFVLKPLEVKIIDQQFAQDCYYRLRVPRSQPDAVREQFLATNGVKLA